MIGPTFRLYPPRAALKETCVSCGYTGHQGHFSSWHDGTRYELVCSHQPRPTLQARGCLGMLSTALVEASKHVTVRPKIARQLS